MSKSIYFPHRYNALKMAYLDWKDIQGETSDDLFIKAERWESYKRFNRERDNVQWLLDNRPPVLMPGELIFLDKLGLIRENAPQGPY